MKSPDFSLANSRTAPFSSSVLQISLPRPVGTLYSCLRQRRPLSLDLQEKVIRFAWAKATEFKAFLILSMWEETYFSSKRGSRVLSTMRTVPLQIARQSIGSVLIKRLQYLIKQISEGKEPLTLLKREHL